jgi:hypothetical protein
MELFLLYIWLKLSSVVVVLSLATVGTVFCIIYNFIGMENYEEEKYPTLHALYKKQCNKCCVVGMVLVFLLVIIPSKTDVAILVGANYAFKAVDTPEAQKVMTLIRKKANEMLDEELKEEKK